MERFRPRPVAAFAALTLLIWGNRIWLAWTNPDDTVAEKLVWSTPITVFVIISSAVLVQLVREADVTAGPLRRAVQVFAGGTVAYWAVRAPMILAADHPGPFKVVHGVLATVSVVAAVWAWRSLDAEVAARPEPEPAALV